MKKPILVLLLVVLFASLTRCGKRLTEGEVYEKEFIPEHSVTRFVPLYIYNGKSSTMVMMPYIYHYPDTWKIYIKDFQDDAWITESYCVPEDLYEGIEIGDIFRYDKDRDLLEAPYTRERVE